MICMSCPSLSAWFESPRSAALQAKAKRVNYVQLQVGALSGVVSDALRFSYDVVTKGTLLEGSELLIEEIPVAVYCDVCRAERELPALDSFRCPACGDPGAEIVRGKELEIRHLEVEP